MGVGKTLMDAMLAHPRLRETHIIYLDVFAENEKATSLYKKYGFKMIGRTPFTLNGKIVGYDEIMKCSRNTI